MTVPVHIRLARWARVSSVSDGLTTSCLDDVAEDRPSHEVWPSGAACDGFRSLAALLAPNLAPDTYDVICQAALDLTGADRAWVTGPDKNVLGSAGQAGPRWADAMPSRRVEVRSIALGGPHARLGTLGLWYESGRPTDDPALEEAFEAALGAGMQARRLIDEGRQLSLRDPLTGLLNRRAFDEMLPPLVALCRRTGKPLGALMLDLDHFKGVNDAHGHHAGDAVLVAFAHQLQSAVRGSDLAFRMGGEEFLVILAEANEAAALGVAEKLREATGGLEVDVEGEMLRVTVSVGIAELRSGESQEELVERADQALYRAKSNGRDRCVVASTLT